MQIEKQNTFSNDILIIDGLWGSGKSLLAPIISGMSNVEKVKIESIYEYVSWMSRLKKVDNDAAIWLLRSYADMSQYHNVIGREVNLRWSDDSGLKFAVDKFKLIRRLFCAEGDDRVIEINNKNLGLCIMSHMLMLAPELLIPAFGSRIKIVEMVRHPLYMVEHFKNYLKRFESPREFTISFYSDGVKVPWFAVGWEYDFVHASPLERAVLCIQKLCLSLFQELSISKANGLAILDVSFEQMVFDTDAVLLKLELFTDRSHHKSINSILKKQKIPRESIAAGRGHGSYGWVKGNLSEEDAYLNHIQAIKSGCGANLFQDFNNLIVRYNDSYPSKLKRFEGII
jgi:hypothetical protein